MSSSTTWIFLWLMAQMLAEDRAFGIFAVTKLGSIAPSKQRRFCLHLRSGCEDSLTRSKAAPATVNREGDEIMGKLFLSMLIGAVVMLAMTDGSKDVSRGAFCWRRRGRGGGAEMSIRRFAGFPAGRMVPLCPVDVGRAAGAGLSGGRGGGWFGRSGSSRCNAKGTSRSAGRTRIDRTVIVRPRRRSGGQPGSACHPTSADSWCLRSARGRPRRSSATPRLAALVVSHAGSRGCGACQT